MLFRSGKRRRNWSMGLPEKRTGGSLDCCPRPAAFLLDRWLRRDLVRGGLTALACRLDAHSVERAVDEEHRDREAHAGDDPGHLRRRVGLAHLLGELDGEEPEERRELDDRVERDGR